MKFPNRNQVLIVMGLLATQGPNLDAVAKWLAASGIPHLTGIVSLLGWVATALGGLALAWPQIRGLLAAGGLATPPGAQAPWNPAVDTGVVPIPPPAPPVTGATPIAVVPPRRGPYGTPGSP